MPSKPVLPGLKSRSLGLAASRLMPLILRASLSSLPRGSFGGSREIEEPARLYLERPGKMLRPLIAALVLEGFGKKAREYSGALGAIELMEASTVSFDDIIDGSGMRRGGPSTHEKFGVNRAYLAYQAAYNRAYDAFMSADLELEPRRRAYILETLSREIFAYGYGQALELYWSAKRMAPSPEQYLSMSWDRIRFLSFNGPFRIGAILGGCAPGYLRHFEEAGAWLGMAYHLHGDELNLFPRSRSWGKVLADDITSGRYTYLYLSALRLCSSRERGILSSAIGNTAVSSAALKNVIDIIRGSGALMENRKKIDGFYAKTVAALKKCPLKGRYAGLLRDLARYMAYERTK